MKCIKILSLFLLSALLLTGCGIKDKTAIVKVNGHVITKGDYDELFKQTIKSPALQMFDLNSKKVDKNSFMYLMIKDKVVNELIVRSLISDEMKKRNITVSAKDTEDALNKTIEQIGSKEKFNEVLKYHGISLASFKKDLVEEVKMRKLVDMLEKVNVSDADAKKYYNANINRFKYPDKVRASHILIAANKNELKELLKSEKKNTQLSEEELNKLVEAKMAEKLNLAKETLAKVKNSPESFAKVAKDVSEDVESAKQGGDLGFFTKQEMVEPFAKVAFELQPNTVSEIVQTPYGYHIILVTDRKAAGQDSFEKVKDDIKLYLENEKKVKILGNFIESLKKTAKIEYIDKEYNPTDIKAALQEQAKKNSYMTEQVDGTKKSAETAKTEPKKIENTKK